MPRVRCDHQLLALNLKNGLCLVGELNTLLDATSELLSELSKLLLLVLAKLAITKVALKTLRAKLNGGGEELVLGDVRLDIGALNNVGLALKTTEEGEGETGTSVGHGESGRASASLGVHHLGTSILNPGSELLDLLLGEANLGGGLGEEGKDGDTSVATDDGNDDLAGVEALELSNEGAGTDNIEGGHTEDALGVIDTSLLVDLSNDGNGGVHGVSDDANKGLGAVLGASLSKGLDNGGVGVEEVITGHTRLAGNTSGDDDNIAASEGSRKLVSTNVASDLGRGVDVAKISGNTRGVHDIVEGEVGDIRVLLNEEGEGLTNTTRGTENSDLVQVLGGAVEATAGHGNLRGESTGQHFRESLPRSRSELVPMYSALIPLLGIN
eukprot:Colp12_sorted_trinity150504_noHs@4722